MLDGDDHAVFGGGGDVGGLGEEGGGSGGVRGCAGAIDGRARDVGLDWDRTGVRAPENLGWPLGEPLDLREVVREFSER